MRTQYNAEKEHRSSLQVKLFELEEKYSKSTYSDDVDTHKLSELENQLKDYSVKYETLKTEKEAEIGRLQRRIELLSETVTNLTQSTNSSNSMPLSVNSGSNSSNNNFPQGISSKTEQPKLQINEIQDTISDAEKIALIQESINQRKLKSEKIIQELLPPNSSVLLSKSTKSTANITDMSISSNVASHRLTINNSVNDAISKAQQVIDKAKLKYSDGDNSLMQIEISPTSKIQLDNSSSLLTELEPPAHQESVFKNKIKESVRISQEYQLKNSPNKPPNFQSLEPYNNNQQSWDGLLSSS